MDIQIPTNGRVFIAGQTGSGKSYLAKRLLENVPRLLVIDSKHNLAKDMRLERATKKRLAAFIRGEDMRLQVKTPKHVDDRTVMRFCENIFRMAEVAADCTVYIDEAMHITIPSVDPPMLKGLYTRGREIIYDDKGRIKAGGIGVVACSQRPSRIPLFMITESEYKFCFRIMNPDDRLRMAGYMGQAVKRLITDDHGFYYYENGMLKPVYEDKYEG